VRFNHHPHEGGEKPIIGSEKLAWSESLFLTKPPSSRPEVSDLMAFLRTLDVEYTVDEPKLP